MRISATLVLSQRLQICSNCVREMIVCLLEKSVRIPILHFTHIRAHGLCAFVSLMDYNRIVRVHFFLFFVVDAFTYFPLECHSLVAVVIFQFMPIFFYLYHYEFSWPFKYYNSAYTHSADTHTHIQFN